MQNTVAMREKAEKDIQKILLDLYNETEFDIESVHVDTRRYANFAVEIRFVADAVQD